MISDMTLVLTALTPTHIVQVSDRRLTRSWSRTRIEQIDGKIKAIITPVFACSYTGPAALGAANTGEWIAITLSDHIQDDDGGLEALRVAASAELKARGLQGQPFAIACAGWGAGDPPVPRYASSATSTSARVLTRPSNNRRTCRSTGRS